MSDGAFLRERCYACGHILAFAATACPQCNEAFDDRRNPKRWPTVCDCSRCVAARGDGK